MLLVVVETALFILPVSLSISRTMRFLLSGLVRALRLVVFPESISLSLSLVTFR